MGFLSSVGGILNNVTGATSSAKDQLRNQEKLNKMSYEQQKEFAQNAHQWEMEDLKKAGLNPALTMGTGGGATAGGAGGAGTASSGSSSGIDLINSAVSAYTAKSNKDKIQAEIGNLGEDTVQKALTNNLIQKYGDKEKNIQLANIAQDTALKRGQITNLENDNQLKQAQAENHKITSAREKLNYELDKKFSHDDRLFDNIGRMRNNSLKKHQEIESNERSKSERYNRKYGRAGREIGSVIGGWLGAK